LQASDFCVVSEKERILASGTLWDQRSFKQTVVRQYAPALGLARTASNAFAHIFGQPRLPAIGEPLATAFASHLAARENEPDALVALLQQLRLTAEQRGIELLMLGFAATDPRLTTVRRRFRCREYRSRLYVVRWLDIGRPARELDGRILAPEVALL
jgi:hypothetical protein